MDSQEFEIGKPTRIILNGGPDAISDHSGMVKAFGIQTVWSEDAGEFRRIITIELKFIENWPPMKARTA